MSLAVVSDFDGTVVDIDTCVHVLEKFAREDWRIYDEQFERGQLTLEECLKRQFSTVTARRNAILTEDEQAFSFRDGFPEFVEYCQAREIPFTIASAGLDFVIDHLLTLGGLMGHVRIIAPKSKLTATGIQLEFPSLLYGTSECFKDDLVLLIQKRGRRVVYIGDGVADYAAARKADIPFAVSNSKLARLLNENMIPHQEIREFGEVLQSIQDYKK